jgi:mono/diheme cytochrome c family protein
MRKGRLMKHFKLATCLAAAFCLGNSTHLLAQTEDIFAFIPDGGRTILERVFKQGIPPAEISTLLTHEKQGSDTWLGDLQSLSSSFEAGDKLNEQQLSTAAHYLQNNMPLNAASVPSDAAKADWGKILPPDGRDLTMAHCQSCHIITVVVTQSRTREAWLGTMNKPSHIEIETTPLQRQEIADYLVLNAGIPIELIPEELRAGGATY